MPVKSRGHPGYWLVFALAAGGSLGLLVLLGVDEPMRRPWGALAAVAGVVAAEVLAAGVLGWKGPEDDGGSGSTRGLLVAMIGIPLAVLALIASLVLYGLTDSPVAAWAAVLSLIAIGICKWVSDYLAESS